MENINRTVSMLQYYVPLRYCTMVRAVCTGQSTVSGFDLAWFSSLSSKCLCVSLIFMVLLYFFSKFVSFFTLPFNELSLVGLVLGLVDYPLSFSAITLLVGSSDP